MTDKSDPYSESDRISRRSFLRGTATGILGLGAGISIFNSKNKNALRPETETVVRNYESDEGPDINLTNNLGGLYDVDIIYTSSSENGLDGIRARIEYLPENPDNKPVLLEATFVYPDTQDVTKTEKLDSDKKTGEFYIESYMDSSAQDINLELNYSYY